MFGNNEYRVGQLFGTMWWKPRVALLVLFAIVAATTVLERASAANYNVEFMYDNATASTVSPTWTGTTPGANASSPSTTSSQGTTPRYTIHNNTLMVLVQNYYKTGDGSGSDPYRYIPSGYSWSSVTVNTGDTLSIQDHTGFTTLTDGTASGGPAGTLGSGVTVNVVQDGRVIGTVNLGGTNNLNVGATGTGTTNGTISGTVNMNNGNINIGGTTTGDGGQVTGSGHIIAGGAGQTTAAQTGGTVAGEVRVAGNNSSYTLTDGVITGSSGDIHYTGTGASFTQNGGSINNNAHIRYDNTDATFLQTDGTINNARVTYGGVDAKFEQRNNGMITGGTVINYTNTGASFLQTNGTIQGATKITYDGDSAVFVQANGTIQGATEITYHGDGALFEQRDGNISGGTRITYNGTTIPPVGSNPKVVTAFVQNGGTVTDSFITYTGVEAAFVQNAGTITGSTITYTEDNASFAQTGGTITGGTVITYNGDNVTGWMVDTTGVQHFTGGSKKTYEGDNTILTIDETGKGYGTPNYVGVLIDDGLITFEGTNTLTDIMGGTITGASTANNAKIVYEEGSALVQLHGNVDSEDPGQTAGHSSAGIINGHATVTFNKAGTVANIQKDPLNPVIGNVFDQFGLGTQAGGVDDNAAITMNRDVSNDGVYNDPLRLHDGTNTYILREDAFIATAPDGVAPTNAPIVTMTGGRATFDQSGQSTINDRSQINMSGVYERQVLNSEGNLELRTDGNVFNQYGTSSINDNVAVTMASGYNTFNQHGSATINDDTTITITGGRNTFNQSDYAEINDKTKILITGGNNYFHQFGWNGASINNTTDLTITGGSNVQEQEGNTEINSTIGSGSAGDGVRITMEDGSNIYLQHASSSINTTDNSRAIISLTGTANGLYRQYENATINDNAEINIITGTNNIFHMFSTTADTDGANTNLKITDNASVNMTQTSSRGNYFLMESGAISSVGTLAVFDSNNDTGNVININGDSTSKNVFTQLGGRVSTVDSGSDTTLDKAKINLNGKKSVQNIFELSTTNSANKAFNDYTVYIGSNDDTDNDISTHGIYHQSAGRKNGTVTITGAQNLFWVNGVADYDANTFINSGYGATSGKNVAVIDLAPGSNRGHSTYNSHSGAADTVHENDPAFHGFLDMSGTTTGNNNVFLANGDVFGTITTSGTDTANRSDSVTNVFVGYVGYEEGKNQGYSWYRNDDDYNLTGLAPNAIENNDDPSFGEEPSNRVPVLNDAGPKIGDYFSLETQVKSTTNNHLEVKNIVGGGGEMHVQVTAGNAYNIKGIQGERDDKIDADMFNATSGGLPYNYPYMISNMIYQNGFAGNPSAKYSWIYQGETGTGQLPTTPGHSYYDFNYTTHFSNDRDYQVYSVLNQDLVNVGAYVDNRSGNDYLFHSATNITIGAITDKWTLDNSYGAINLNDSTQYMPVMWDSNGTALRDNHTNMYYDNPANYGPHTYSEFYEGKQAQITAGMVNVYAGSKLTIHQNYDATAAGGFTFDQSNATDARRNIIDNLNIVGAPDENEENCEDCGYTTKSDYRAIVTLDRTTIHTLTDGLSITHYQDKKALGYTTAENITSNVIVGTNGILQGFGEFKSATDHSPKHANIVGDVAVLAGGMIRPYDGAVQNEVTGEQTSGIFVIHGNALQGKPGYDPNNNFSDNVTNLMGVTMKIDGTMYFESMSRLSTRLFAVKDGVNTLDVISDGSDTTIGNDRYTPNGEISTIQKYWGDSLEVTKEINFNEVAYSSIYLQNGIFNPFSPAELAAGVSAAGEPITALFNKRIGDLSVWQGVSQHHKVQYVPTFGFVNELYSKLNYNIYRGDDQTGEQTYYYQVMYADPNARNIAALEGMPDANHIFNRDILFSDMLGNWSFEKQDGGKGVVLRFRLLAKHPQDGGIAIDEKIRNSREVALKLDEIRYPFLTAYNMADSSLQGLFHRDPSLDGDTTADGQVGVEYDTPYEHGAANEDPYYAYGGNPYDRSGFDGDIETYYRENRDRFTNYREEWVKDISNYLHALQLNLGSSAEIHRSLRLLSAEPYASQASADLQTMNMFINSRERNAVSAMFLVEKEKEPTPEPNPDNYYGNFVDPIAKDAPAGYVDNPVRFWSTALGYHSYRNGVGDEYGYNTHASGMQFGSIKEKGDIYYGLTGGYTRSRNSWDELQTINHTDNYMGEALFGVRQDFGFIEGHLNYGHSEHKMERDLTQGSYLNGGEYDAYMDCDTTDNYFNGVYKANHTGEYTSLTRGGGLRVGLQKVFFGKWLFLPTLGVRYMDIRNKSGFTEKGKDIDAFRIVFDKNSIKRESLQIPMMMRISRSIGFNNGGPTIITPELRLGATVECLDKNGQIENFKWIGNPIPNRYMKAWGLKEDRVQFQIGTTIEVSRRGRFYAAVNYDLNFDDSFSSYNHSFSLQSGVNF